MNPLKHDKRFFESTRGQIVLLLRGGPRTVNELVAGLGLTDNAVRAHLLSLERDGLVLQGSPVKGFRKPHFSYALTAEARHLFPKPYDSLFNRLLDVLKARMVTVVVKDFLTEAGQKIGRQNRLDAGAALESRIEKAAAVLEELGGAPNIVRENGNVTIKSASCPFAEAVSEHPEVCKLAEAVVSEIVGLPARETCDRTGAPRCTFEVDTATAKFSGD